MIRIGANPIGWSNDDMPELGGKTPLETCLEGSQARPASRAWSSATSSRARPAALKAVLEPFGLACVSGWYSAELLPRDVNEEMKAHAGASRPPEGAGLAHPRSSPRPRTTCTATARKPLSQRPMLSGRRLGRVRPAHDRARRADRERGRAPRLSPPHGHGGAVGERHRRLWRRPATPCSFSSTPAMRPGAAPIRRRWRGATAPASATSMARTCARR